jgi:diguanylate cyclase (GGDEF)-like protein
MSAPTRILRESSLFRGVGPDVTATLLERFPIRTLQAGDPLLSPDQPNHFLYVVLNGELQVLVGPAGSATSILVTAGNCVGEMSIIDGGRVSAPVVATGDSAVLGIDVDNFWRLTETVPTIARNLLGIMAERMRSTNEALALSLQLQQAYERWAFLDPLTAAYNRRWIDQTLPRYVERARRDASAFTLGVFDIDHFKRYNDTHGHPAGDAALRATVRAAQSHIRPADRLARIGGEEFCVLLPDTDLPGAQIVAARLVQAIAANPVQASDGTPLSGVTISLGLAQASADSSPDDLIAAADKALYGAKRDGRNRFAS